MIKGGGGQLFALNYYTKDNILRWYCMLELYNMTNEVRRVPKYRYNGEYVLQPKESVEIHEEHAYFFKPYSQIGVVVRVGVNKKSNQQVLDINPEEVATNTEESEKESEKPEEQVEKQVKETPIEGKDDKEITEETTEETTEKTDNNTYEEIRNNVDNMSMSELRDTATKMGIYIKGVRKKEDIKELILNKINA